MKNRIIALMSIFAMSMLVASCGAPAANNSANSGKAASPATAPTGDKAAIEGEVKKVVDDFVAAINKGDAAALEKMYSDDYMLIDANGGIVTKAARVEAIKSGKVKMEGMTTSDVKMKTNPSGDGAVVTAKVTGKTTSDGKTTDTNIMVTWVLGKMKDKGWQFINAHITNINAAAAKPDAAKADDKKPEASPAATK